jgi:hypothetical protein
MPTQQKHFASVTSGSVNYLYDQGFFIRFSSVMVAVIVIGFMQWNLRGMVDVGTVPLWVHLHGGLMLAWLGLFIGQNLLARTATLDLHRKLGWVATGIVAAILLTGIFTGVRAVELHRVPPFFSNAFFLALTFTETAAFALLVAAGVAMRRRTEWHRRLMMGATIIILEPAFGRLLPMPLMGGWAEWIVMVIQLGFVAVLARHDVVRGGKVHSATLAVAAAVVATHCVMSLLAQFPPFVAVADGLAAAG